MLFSLVIYSVILFGGRYLIYNEPRWCKSVPPSILSLWIYLHGFFPFEFVFYTLGDHFMIYVNSLKDVKWLAISVLFFSLAHLLSLEPIFEFFISSYDFLGLPVFPNWFFCLWIVYISFFFFTLILLSSDIRYIVQGYALILMLRLSLSILYLSTYDIIASLLFCISDLLIMINMLFLHNKNIGSLILMTYWVSLIFRTVSLVGYQC